MTDEIRRKLVTDIHALFESRLGAAMSHELSENYYHGYFGRYEPSQVNMFATHSTRLIKDSGVEFILCRVDHNAETWPMVVEILPPYEGHSGLIICHIPDVLRNDRSADFAVYNRLCHLEKLFPSAAKFTFPHLVKKNTRKFLNQYACLAADRTEAGFIMAELGLVNQKIPTDGYPLALFVDNEANAEFYGGDYFKEFATIVDSHK